jgi:hypothetical protein
MLAAVPPALLRNARRAPSFCLAQAQALIHIREGRTKEVLAGAERRAGGLQRMA